jgi:hypothetical protein
MRHQHQPLHQPPNRPLAIHTSHTMTAPPQVGKHSPESHLCMVSPSKTIAFVFRLRHRPNSMVRTSITAFTLLHYSLGRSTFRNPQITAYDQRTLVLLRVRLSWEFSCQFEPPSLIAKVPSQIRSHLALSTSIQASTSTASSPACFHPLHHQPLFLHLRNCS